MSEACPACGGLRVPSSQYPCSSNPGVAQNAYAVVWWALHTSCCPRSGDYHYRAFGTLEEANAYFQKKKRRLERDSRCHNANPNNLHRDETPNIILFAPGGKKVGEQMELTL